MKPERIQKRLSALAGWSQAKDGRLRRRWLLPSRRSAGLLNAYLMEMAEGMDLELEVSIRSGPETGSYHRQWQLEARIGRGEPTLELFAAANRLEGLPT